MKKRYYVFFFFVLCCLPVFCNTEKQEEVDFLLFSPNSGNRFENEEQAFIQLNNLAVYLANTKLISGQITVYGYAAYAPNDIKSVDLSRERALTVMEELQKRGISKELFAAPVGYGAVSTWGDNTDEDSRKLNRRVRILLSGESPVTITQEIITAEIETPKAVTPGAEMSRAEVRYYAGNAQKKSNYKFLWWILPVLALVFLFLLLPLLLFGKRAGRNTHKYKSYYIKHQIPRTENEQKFTPEEAVTTWMVNLDDEIRLRAYELSLERGGTGDYREQDWYNAVHEVSAWYTACGHSVFIDGGRWWASRSHNYDFQVTAVS